MGNEQELRKTLENTLSKYKNNKEKVPAADLAGKYKQAFDKLKDRLRQETEAYLIEITLSGFRIRGDDSAGIIQEMQRSISENQIGKKAGRAIFKNYSIAELEQIAKEQRAIIEQIYKKYFDQHTCLYITDPCLREENPQAPLIYNDLSEEFFSLENNRWYRREKPAGEAAVLLFVKGREEAKAE